MELLEGAVVGELFENCLGVEVNSVHHIHALGKKVEGETRPIIMNFACYKERPQVLKNCSKLKSSQLFLSEDFCWNALEKRKKLWKSSNVHRDNGDEVKLSHDKLTINRETFVWEKRASCRVKITEKKEFTTTQHD